MTAPHKVLFCAGIGAIRHDWKYEFMEEELREMLFCLIVFMNTPLQQGELLR